MVSDLSPSGSKNKIKRMKLISIIVIGIVLLGLALSVSGCIDNKTYTVTYAPGTHGTFSPQDISGIASGSQTPTAPTAIGEPGYIFNGWSPEIKPTVTENITYTAQWIEGHLEYTVTYAPGSHGTFPAKVTNGLVAGTATPAAPATTGESGYFFNGWSPAVKSTVTENITYTAQWTDADPAIDFINFILENINYTVTYAPGSHGTFPAQVTGGLAHGSKTPAAPTTTGQSGYVFNGWSPAVKSTVTENITYTAQWTDADPANNSIIKFILENINYTVTYAPGSHGTFPAQVTSGLAHGSKTPAAPTTTGQPGYVFNGWSPTVKSNVTENITYTAQWIKEPPNVYVTGHTSYSNPQNHRIIDVSVHNYGGDGAVVVWTTVTQGKNEWTLSQPVHLNSKETKKVIFVFFEPSALSSINYNIWIEN
ncbi:MAG: InlB B-repeat-containing protein [Methanimicrococcus sp.]|nr:InlB B-repeat-containing protein [Methanimicrococcus sp.]